MRRFRRRSRGARSTRAREWVRWNIQDPGTGRINAFATLGAGNLYGSCILTAGDMQAVFDEPTIVRNILHWSWAFRTLPTTPEVASFAWGLIRTNVNLAAGVVPGAALPYIPHPWYDADADWIYNSVQQAISENITVQRGFSNEMAGNGLVDVRTKRKFEGGHNLVAAAWFDASNGAQICDFTIGGRSLFLNR